MKYNDMIKINQNFQSSINLELDFKSERKIREYIPTSDICDVLKKYFYTFLNYNQNHSTLLEGPYGKGKSFLLLILSYLIGKKEKNETYINLLCRIKTVDEELYDLIVEFDEKDLVFLPVIVNSTYENLNQSFMLALNDALAREELSNIIPNTAYSVCLDILDKWENDESFNEKIQKECQKKGRTIAKIRRGLKEYDQEAYRQFKSLYKCVSVGLEFNPLVNNDVVKIYSDISHKLPEYGYSGFFVIFDEFSKFLESSSDDLAKHLKMIQDFAEKANRSDKNEQINFCCVTHKSLELYSNKTKADALKTVEGRFKEIRFNRSLAENYQIISSAIRKTNQANIDKKIKEKYTFYQELASEEMFKDVNDFKHVAYGFFPLNPVTVYALIHLSEIVAQNERTLFTFLSDTDENSFNSFIQNEENGLFNVDKIFDYFSVLLKKEEENSIRNIWYRSEAVLSKVTDQIDRRIIKALAIILMINELDVFSPDERTLHLSLDIDKSIIERKIKELVDKHFLRKNTINGLLSLASANSKEIDEQIEIVSKTKLRNISYSDVLAEIDENKYVLPRRYNANYKITRFYHIAYLTEEQFLNLKSFMILKEKCFCDGLIIHLIREKLAEKEIEDVIKKIADPTVIVKYPKNHVDLYFKSMIKRYAALKEIILKSDSDDVVTSELMLLNEETIDDVRSLIEKYYENEFGFYASNINKNQSYTDLLSAIFENIYYKTIIFNNELVNKNAVSVQYQKPINHIGDLLLENATQSVKELYSETSPEMTVYNSIVKRIQRDDLAKEVVKEIKDTIQLAEEKKVSFQKIVEKYYLAPYGLRKGVMPVILCYAIGELSENVTLYMQKKEIDLNASNISKAINSSSGYYINFAKGSGDQSKYVYDLMTVLNIESSNNFRRDIRELCSGLRKFFVGLPQIIRNCKIEKLQIPSTIYSYSKLFMTYDINPTDTILCEPIEIFGSYQKARNELYDYIQTWEKYLNSYKNYIITTVKDIFGITQETSIKMGMSNFLKQMFKNGKPILSDYDHVIMDCLENLSFDDYEAIDDISKAVVGVYIEDWNNDRVEELSEKMHKFVTDITVSDKIILNETPLSIFESVNSVEQTQMGKLLQNGVESIFEEYGEAVSNEEKIMILSKLIKNLM